MQQKEIFKWSDFHLIRIITLIILWSRYENKVTELKLMMEISEKEEATDCLIEGHVKRTLDEVEF